MLEPSWTGRRVSVRCAVAAPGAGGRPSYRDVVGDLLELGADRAVVETRGGPVEIALADVAVARLAPPSTADELALEGLAARAWQPDETAWLGGWLLRAGPGLPRRATSVLPLRAPDRPLDEALAAARDWCARRGLPLVLAVPAEARRLLDAGLGERGWPVLAEDALLARRLDGDGTPGSSGAAVEGLELRDAPDAEWLAACQPAPSATGGLPALLVRHPGPLVFAGLRRGGELAAVARGTVEQGWLGVTALHVQPAHRRHGLGRALLSALAGWGREHGAMRAFAQVAADDRAALALGEQQGWWRHHDLRYRTPPPGEPGSALPAEAPDR